MKTIKINIDNFKKQEIDLVVDFLKKGKVIVYPTDTIYGLGCLATDKKAIDKIYRIKKREKKKPLIIFVSDFKMLAKYSIFDSVQKKFLKQIWPGPISVILNKKGKLLDELSGGLSSVAVRLPKSRFLTKIIKGVGCPLVSTSLNLSGEKPLYKVDDLDEFFKGLKPDLIVDFGVKYSQPSKLIDLRDINDIKILRK
ncbi:MAG: L-threonylcarbamoyladenylate synthase [Patescibacteria group bacterium]|jgi:L-threonylcarbamoyladenylate synthase